MKVTRRELKMRRSRRKQEDIGEIRGAKDISLRKSKEKMQNMKASAEHRKDYVESSIVMGLNRWARTDGEGQ